jgi:hypothetical protein
MNVHFNPAMASHAHSGQLLWAVPLAVMLMAAGCGTRSLPQTRNLDSETRVVVEDMWLLDHTPRLLDVLCTYQGPDPAARYALDALLSEQSHGPFHKRGWTKQIPIPQQGTSTNEIKVLWQFGGFPRDTQHIYLRLSYRDRMTGQSGSIDFQLPGSRQLRVRELGSQ